MSDMDVGVDAVKRIRDAPSEGIRMATGGPVTQKLLETIEHNNNLINDLSLDIVVANVNGEPNKAGKNKPRKKGKHKATLDRDIVVYAANHNMNLGAANTVTTSEGYKAFKEFRIDFPSNANGDFFHDQFLPVVILQPVKTAGVNYPPYSVTPIRIATNFVKFDVYFLEDSTLGGGTDFWISVFAMGRKGDYYEDLSEKLITPNTVGTLD